MGSSKRTIKKFIKDPVVDYVTLDADELEVVQNQYFQRLRYIKQNSTAYLTYPMLCGVTRFDHSLGVMEMADRVLVNGLNNPTDETIKDEFLQGCCEEFGIDKTEADWKEQVENRLRKIIRLAGLSHDLGHFPFSHTTEKVLENFIRHSTEDTFKKLFNEAQQAEAREFITLNAELKKAGKPKVGLHEFTSAKVVDSLPLEDALKKHIVNILLYPGTSPIFKALNSIITSDLDVDKIDYILRDGGASGGDFRGFDINRLIASFKLYRENGDYYFLPSEQALSSIETMLAERLKLYRWVYYHQHVILTDYLLSKSIELLLNVFVDREDIREEAPGQFDGIIQLSEKLVSRIHYLNYVDHGTYFDDIFLFSLLRELFEHLSRIDMGGGKSLASQKVMLVYLKGLLTRAKVAVPLWKKPARFTMLDGYFRSHLAKDMTAPRIFLREEIQAPKIAINKMVERLIDKAKIEEFEKSITEKIKSEIDESYSLFLITKSFTPYHLPETQTDEESRILMRTDEGWIAVWVSQITQMATGLNNAWEGFPHSFAFIISESGEPPATDKAERVREIFPEFLFNYAKEMAKTLR